MKKRNLLIIGSSQGVYGGIEAFMIAIASAAKEWNDFNVRLCFKIVDGYSFESEFKKVLDDSNINYELVSKGSSNLLRNIWWADVLHVQNMPPDIVIPAFLLRRKIFLTVHNRKMPELKLRNGIWKMSMLLANKRWYNSRFVWNTWEPEKKMLNSDCIPTVCNMTLDMAPFEGRKGFIFIGRWIENKGIEELIKAYANAQLNTIEYPLVIVGDGPLRTKILSLIDDMGLNGRIVLPGFVSDTLKQKLMNNAKWLVAPAKTKEDLGLTPIEARSKGIPSIVTNDGGLPEAAGNAALVVDVNNLEALKDSLIFASQMADTEYARRSHLAFDSLNNYLKPMTFYREQFAK